MRRLESPADADHDARQRRQPFDCAWRQHSPVGRRRDDDGDVARTSELVLREGGAQQLVELTVGQMQDVDAVTVAARLARPASIDTVDERVAAWAASGAMALDRTAGSPAARAARAARRTHSSPSVEHSASMRSSFSASALRCSASPVKATTVAAGRRASSAPRRLARRHALPRRRHRRGTGVARARRTAPHDGCLDGSHHGRRAHTRSNTSRREASCSVFPSPRCRNTEPPPRTGLPVVASPRIDTSTPADERPPLVVDLSSLWAGPLCSHLLQRNGARVIKVESAHRPDAARAGSPEFFDLLNTGKQSVVVDVRTNDGRHALRRLAHCRRCRHRSIATPRPRTTRRDRRRAHARRERTRPSGSRSPATGATGEAANRVAFGDDAAVAGGLVVYDDRGPCFCADAIADPLTGMVAAAACLERLLRHKADGSCRRRHGERRSATSPVRHSTAARPPSAVVRSDGARPRRPPQRRSGATPARSSKHSPPE